MIPRVDDLKSSPMTRRFGDPYNPPALTNFLGCVQAEIDVSGVRCLNFPPFATSVTLTGAFVLENRHFQALGVPVTLTWYPDRILREAQFGDLQLQSTTVLAVDEMAVIVRVAVTNRGTATVETTTGLNIQGCLARNNKPWNSPLPTHELANLAQTDPTRSCVVFTTQDGEAVGVQGVRPQADIVRETGFRYDLRLAPGETWQLTYAYTIGENLEQAISLFDRIIDSADAEIDRVTANWNDELEAVFTPDNDRFSGHLPRLETSDQAIRKLYWMGALGVIYFKRDSPYSVMGRTYDTLLPRYWQSVTFLWDYFLSSSVHAQLDPTVMKKYLEHWIRADLYKHFGTEYLTGGTVGYWYSVNDYAMTTMIRDYVRWTGDVAWLEHVIEGTDRRVIDFLVDYAEHWKGLRGAHGLADYGNINNLLECVSTYIHEVASLNAANVHNMRVAAELLELLGDVQESSVLRKDADALVRDLMSLYVPQRGFWRTRFPDGQTHEVRHCYDLLTILNTIPADLTSEQKQEMVEFFSRELQSETWMHALSPEDDNVLFDVRPDHQWTGAYPAWPPETARGLFRIGAAELAIPWLRGLAQTANQGPYGQAHFADDVVEREDGGAMKSHPEMPCITDWACSSSGSFVNVVIEGIFGVHATAAGDITADPQFASFDPEARLQNLAYQGKLYTVTRDGLQEQIEIGN
jgi:hypothetical protein